VEEKAQPMKESAEQSSLASEAYTVVRQRILRGDITLGQVISRRKLAAELSMSFLPVSEALLRLEIEGLLESRPRAGTRVRIPSPEDVQGHYVVREALEVQAAMRFASVATPGERAELKKLAVRVDQLSMQLDRPLYQAVHQKLHARIAQCARCPALLDAIEKTHALASIWFCVMRRPKPDDSPTRHQELAEAVCSGDPNRAADEVRRHLAVAVEHSLEVLEPYFRLRKATGRTFHRSDKKLRQGPLDLSQLH
jgi:GntR family transcriptional regulator, rspAB operon transcriptional repressor